jgi:LysM repeat protein
MLKAPAEPDAEGRVTLEGTGTPGSTVQIMVDGEAMGEVTVGDDGTWVYPATLSPGEHQLQARALDDEGAVVGSSEAMAVEVPTPTATPLPIIAPTLDTPATPDAEGRVTLEGTGTPGSMVQIIVDGEAVEDVTVGDDGTWAYPATIAPGEHQLQARALDDEGTVVAESRAITFAVPMPPGTPTATPEPVTALTMEIPTESDAGGNVTLRGTGAPSGGTVQIVVDSEVLEDVTVGESGTWVYTATLSPGEHQLQARALDEEGTVIAESEVVTFSQPELVQAPAILTPTQGITLTAGVVQIAGTGSPSAALEVLLNGEVLSTTVVSEDGAWAISRVISPGTYSLTVQVPDDPERLSQSLSFMVEASSVDEGEGAEDVEEGCGIGEIRDDTYIVAPCEYIALIAERAGVTVEALLAANPDLEDPDLIYPGQVLNLPPRD